MIKEATRSKVAVYLMVLATFSMIILVGGLAMDVQNIQICDYCLQHPNDTLTGDLVVNCSECYGFCQNYSKDYWGYVDWGTHFIPYSFSKVLN